jgi:hypothetical protein
MACFGSHWGHGLLGPTCRLSHMRACQTWHKHKMIIDFLETNIAPSRILKATITFHISFFYHLAPVLGPHSMISLKSFLDSLQ